MATGPDPRLEQAAVHAIRVLAMDAVQKAKSGHPGLPLGAADLAAVVWSRFLRFDPTRPEWPDRDRFVLSAGHGSMLLYALLHLTGYDLPLEELQRFRQWGSRTPGHPEFGHTPGVETTTGPLGQGLATAVGMAMAERHLAARMNEPGHPVVDHRTFVLASDGDLMEGVQSEAASLAGHLGLGKLIVLYDDNRITIDGETSLAFSEDVAARYLAYGWHVQRIDGHDRNAIADAVQAALDATGRPSLIAARTHIAYGSPNKQDSEEAHGSPLGEEEVRLTKRAYGWPEEPAFFVPEDVRTYWRDVGARGRGLRAAWESGLQTFFDEYPHKSTLWRSLHADPAPAPAGRPAYEPGAVTATRAASGKAIAWLSPAVPALWGGSADLAPSNLTLVPGEPAFSRETPEGRNIHFGIREHAMAAALNGMALHGGVVPYGGTFLVFSDYLRPSLRLSALMGLRVIYVFTHDSIFLGEDGPTHQPVEHLAALRSIPGLTVLRPADGEETTQAWEIALARRGPTALVLTRQGLPELNRTAREISEGVAAGAYVVRRAGDDPRLIAFATGSEVATALAAADSVDPGGAAIRVVSLPSWELFAEQDAAYRRMVLAPEIRRRVALEAGISFGWERFVGPEGTVLGIDRFGASAPQAELAERFGFTPAAVAERFRELLDANPGTTI